MTESKLYLTRLLTYEYFFKAEVELSIFQVLQ